MTDWIYSVWTVLAAVGSVLLIGRYLLCDHIVFIPGRRRHNWKSIAILGKAVSCSVCEILMSSNGYFCDCCGVCADPTCIKSADKTFKCKEKYIQNDKALVHLWVKGNLPENSKCFKCSSHIDFQHAPGLYGYRCCWCQRNTHKKCLAKISDECDLGIFSNMIVPPNSIVATRNITSPKLHLIDLKLPDSQSWKPLIVIANIKSGSSSAAEVASLFRGVLHPLQVFELSSHGPQEALQWAIKASPRQSRVLVAGGDGTVGWVLNTIFSLNIQPIPEVGIIPLGTGNDLSRVLNWGSGDPFQLNAMEYLDKIAKAESVLLDRWLLKIEVQPSRRLSLSWGSHRSLFIYNYFSVGVDAQVTLNFHKARESPFYMFSSRMINKMLYLCFGTHQVVQPYCVGLEKNIELYLNDVLLDLPELQSVVCLNIDSWGAGVKLWEMSRTGENEENVHCISDGVLEIFGIISSFHIAQLQVGLSQPVFLGRAQNVRIVMKKPCPVQADGEPWIQQPCTITICNSGQARMLKCKS